MSGLEWELIADGFERLEAPCFDGQGRLCFSDRTPPGRVLRIEADGSVTTLCERGYVGGLVAHSEGGLVASGRNVSLIAEDGGQRILLEAESGWGFNDLGTDAEGRVFVGRFDVDPHPPALGQRGSMWRIGTDASVDHCYDGIQLTNGVGVSPDGSTLYHNDTTPRIVWASELTADGMPVNRRPLHEFKEGSPDGMAIDESGCIWIALIGSGKLARLTPDGKEDRVVNGPTAWTSSFCFGDPDPRNLFAVTFGGEPYDPQRSGGVYRATVDVGGAVVHPARV
jgi:sugar lactone lactonase YvrE